MLVPVPSGTSASQVIKIQTQEVSASGKVSNIQTGTRQTPLSTTSGVGIVNLFPEAVYLTKDNPEQIITFYNNGDAQAQLEKLLATNSNVEVEFTPSAIGSNGKSTATLRLKNTSVSATNGNIALTYNNGKSGTTTVGKVDENVYPAPTPSPTPTPTPTPSPGPAPAPTPTAGLTVTVTPNNFNVSTAALNASRVLTLKNTGNTPEAGFTFSLTPGTFSLYSAGPAPTCSVSGNTVTTPLTENQECNLTIEYTSTNTTAGNYTTTMGIAYTYNGGTTATPLSTMYNSNVSQSSANLSSAASSVTDFGNVLNNNTATSSLYFKLTNTGEAQATNLVFSNSLNTLFSTIVSGAPSPACDISGSGTLTAGADCYYGIQFGPIPLSTAAGVQNNVTTVNYAWSSGGATGTPSTTQSTTGAVVTATSAAIALSGPTASGFAGGSGTSVSPYQIQENSTGTLTYTYTNTGTQAASNFYVFSPALPLGWTRSNSSTCPDSSGTAITLPNTGNNSCTAIFNINKNSTGTSDFHQDNMTYYWTDQAHPSGTSLPASSSSTAVNVYATPAVAAVMSSSSTGTPTITNPTESTDFYVVYTLTGGYSGQSFTYGVTLGGTPGSPGMSVYSPTTCTITSPATSCSIKIASGGAVTNQSITYAPQGGAVTPTPASSGNFDVVVPPMFIFVTNGEYWGSFLGGAQSINAICGGDTNAPAGAASMNWNIATLLSNVIQPDTSYVYTDGTTTTSVIDASPSPVNFMSDSTDQTKLFTAQFGTGTQFRYVWGSNKSGTSNNCTSWTTDSPAPNYGGASLWNGSVVTLEAAVNGNGECSNVARLFCVQQPPATIPSVANATLQKGVNEASSCTTVTVTLPAPTAVDIGVNIGIDDLYVANPQSKFYFTGAYGGVGVSTSICNILAGNSSCTGNNILCAGSNAGSIETVHVTAPGYSESTINVTAVAPPSSACTTCGIFITSQFANGDLRAVASSLSLGTFTDGFQAGDAICQYYAGQNSYTGTYKALIAGTNRQPGGTDWVIKASTPYIRTSDSTALGTSTVNGQLPSSLTAAILPNQATVTITGFTNNSQPWAADTSNNCSNWTSASASDYGLTGYAAGLNAYGTTFPPNPGYLNSGGGASSICNNNFTMYCVQQ